MSEQAYVLRRAGGKIVGQIFCEQVPTAKHNCGVRFDRAIAVERHGDPRFETLDEETGTWTAIAGAREAWEKVEARRQRLVAKERDLFLDEDVTAAIKAAVDPLVAANSTLHSHIDALKVRVDTLEQQILTGKP